MGLLDAFESMASQELAQHSDNETARVAGGLVQALQEHPGGLQSVLDTMKQNGLDQHVQGWTSGDSAQPATGEQVQQGLNGTGLIESVAEKAGVSPAVASMVIGTVLPMVVAHFAPNGQVANSSQLGGLASQLLAKFL